jgi:hypothetical protein
VRRVRVADARDVSRRVLSLERVLEAAQAASERAAQLGQSLGAEQQHRDHQEERDVNWAEKS